MTIKHSVVKAPGQPLAAVADWNADHTGTATPDAHTHPPAEITGTAVITNDARLSDARTPTIHGIADATKHSSAATSGKILAADANGLPVNATNTDVQVAAAVTASHAKQHAINAAADHTGYGDSVTKSVGVGAGDVAAGNHNHAGVYAPVLGADDNYVTDAEKAALHAKQHAINAAADHTSTATSGRMLKADANGLPVDATNTDAAVSAAVTASHTRQHAITTAADHTSTATSGKMLKADANGLPIDATNTDAAVAAAVTASHSQNTDTALGSGCVAADHGAAATDMVVNVCYGTGAAPAANTTTEGTIYLTYTA